MAKRLAGETAADHARLVLYAMNGGGRLNPVHPGRDFLNYVIDFAGEPKGGPMLNAMLLVGITELEVSQMPVIWYSHRSHIKREFFDGQDVIEFVDGMYRFNRTALERIARGMPAKD